MAIFAGGKIEAFVGPQELGAADNLEAVIIKFIEGAQHSLDIAVQELDSEPIAQAIIDARWRGVSVRMFMEQDYLAADRLPRPRPRAGETPEEARQRAIWEERRIVLSERTNREILAALLRNAIDVKADLNPEIFHQKFIVRDYRRIATPTSATLTGSANFTLTDTHRNLNHVIIFNDARVCAEYRDEFEELRAGTFGELRDRHPAQPRKINLNGVPVRVLFAPDHTPELEIIKQMLKASTRIDFAMFTFSGSSGVDDALTVLRKAGIEINGALDSTQGRQWWSATRWLHQRGIKIFFPRRNSGVRKLHHKLMVIDESIVLAGSMNYTAPANELNDENLFVLGNPYDLDPGDGGPVDHVACGQIARYFRNEIERIYTLSEPFSGE